jgi:hypothetical protein
MVDAVVTDLLKELNAYAAPVESVEINDQVLQTVPQEEVVDTLAYAMRFDERGKARRTGVEYASTMAASVLVQSLDASGFVLLRRKPAPPHRAGGA